MTRGTLVCLALAALAAGPVWSDGPADDGWQWFELEQRELGPSTRRAKGDYGESYGHLRPSDTAPAGLGELFPDAIWYVGTFYYMAMDRPIVAAVRTYEGRRYTEQWLYVDTDADGRLDDERKLPGVRQPDVEIEPGIVGRPTFEWPAVTATVVSREGDRRRLEIHSSGYMLCAHIVLMPIIEHEHVATGAIGDQDFELHLVDYDGDGRLSAEYWSEDRARFRLPSSGDPSAIWKAPKLRSVMVIGCRIVKLQVDANRPAVGIKPYDEPTNTFTFAATDGRGRPMQVVSVTAALRKIGPLIYVNPPRTIEIPVAEKQSPFISPRRGSRLVYELCYPDRPQVTWQFITDQESSMLTAQHEPSELDVGGPLHLSAELHSRSYQGYTRLQGEGRLRTEDGHTLVDVSDGEQLTWRAWVITPAGDVPTSHIHHEQRAVWWLIADVPADLPADPPPGKYSLNITCDPGEYQEPMRATAHCEL